MIFSGVLPSAFLRQQHGRRGRVFDLDPTLGAARPVRHVAALRHDTLTAEVASVLKNNRAVAFNVFVQHNAAPLPARSGLPHDNRRTLGITVPCGTVGKGG